MKVSFTEYQVFLRAHGRRFPYNQVKKTRNSFHTKWLLLANVDKYIAIPSHCIDNQTQNHLIITYQALPTTQDMDPIIEHMERWERSDPVWHRQVIDWIAFICREGVKRDQYGLVYDCVAFKVRKAIYQHIGCQWELTGRLFHRWSEKFCKKWRNGQRDFGCLVEFTMDMVDDLLRNI